MTREEIKILFEDGSINKEAEDLLREYFKKVMDEKEGIYCSFNYNTYDNIKNNGYLDNECDFWNFCESVKDGHYNMDGY